MSNARFIYKLLKHSGDHADMIAYTRSVWKTNYPSPGMVKERYIYSSKKKKKKRVMNRGPPKEALEKNT